MLYHTVESEIDEKIWSQIVSHEGETFVTARGLEYSYQIKRGKGGQQLGEMIINRKAKTITRSTVLLAYENAMQQMDTIGFVAGPKKLGVFGSSYLYPVFLELGIIRGKEKTEHVASGK